MSNSDAASEVDPAVWRALAGASVQIPAPNSYVYYFPQGHLEHSPSVAAIASILTGNFNLQRPFVPCEVRSIRFLAHISSDQAFAKILLQPLMPYGPRSRSNDWFNINDQNDVVSFVKVLTPSDANNGGGGGGFLVPRYCADSIFPELDLLSRPPPVQNLTFTDTGNNAWVFRHSYRGRPRRHILTTGWSKFMNAKRLVAGDSVVFMRKRSTNELFIGIRRANYKNYASGGGGGGERCEVVEAIDKAARGVAFEVVYYPRVGMFDFVVNAEKVKESLGILWSVGKRVRMGMETEDTSRMIWYQGTITASATPNNGPWRGSPWRMIQVCWDEAQSLRGMNRVSPWQIEHVLLTPLLDTISESLPSKRTRFLQNRKPNRQEEIGLPSTQLTLSVVGHLDSTMLNYSLFPGGIQGARRDNNRLSSSRDDNSHQTFDELPNDMSLALEPVSTVLSIGDLYLVSLDSRSSASQQDGRRNSFQLFGRTIQMSELNSSSPSTRPESNVVLQLN